MRSPPCASTLVGLDDFLYSHSHRCDPRRRWRLSAGGRTLLFVFQLLSLDANYYTVLERARPAQNHYVLDSGGRSKEAAAIIHRHINKYIWPAAVCRCMGGFLAEGAWKRASGKCCCRRLR